MIRSLHGYSRSPKLPGRGRRGALLMLTIWLIIILMVMAYSLSYEMTIGMKMTGQGRRRVQAIGLARAGLAKAVTDLRNDQMLKVSEGLYNNDTPEDIWAKTDDKTDVKLGEGTYTVRVIDEQAKIDVNMMRPEWTNSINYLLMQVCGESDKNATFMTNALLDYMDNDNQPITGDDLTEAEYYSRESYKLFPKRLPKGWIFRPKNDRLIGIDELLEVPGFTRELLYGDPAQVPVNPIDRLGGTKSKRRKPSTALVDYLTVGEGGPININTAPVEVYGALLSIGTQGKQGKSNVKRAAASIDDLRHDLLTRSSKTGIGFLNVGQIMESKVDPILLQGMMRAPLGVSSREYTIVSRGTVGAVGSVSQTIEARIVISLQSYTLDENAQPGQQYIHDLKAVGMLKSRRDLIVDPVLQVRQFKQY